MNPTPSTTGRRKLLLLTLGAFCCSQGSLAQSTITWGSPQDTTGPGDVAQGGPVIEARNGLVFVPYLSDNPADDVTVSGVLFDATNFLGAQFPNEPPGSFIANHTSGNTDYDWLLGNASSCEGSTLGNGSTNASANYEIAGLTVNEDYRVQIWYTDVRGPFDGRAMTIDGTATIESGINATSSDLGQFVVGTFTASATTQSVNIDAAGTAGRAAMSAILVRVDTGSVIGMNYCGPAPLNSNGTSGRMSVIGSRSVTDNDVLLQALDLPTNSFGFFITSLGQGFVTNPNGSQGNLCLSGAIGRYVGPGQIQNSGATGALALQIDLTQHPTPTGLISVAAGDTWNFQAWHRDFVSGMPTSNFSDGVQITFL